MANWYVDHTQSGGNGTDPASAFPSISSITWAPGDKAWVRKTHYELMTNSMVLGPNFNTTAFARWATVIGWPSAGDPYYNDRPAGGVSAGWDSDVCSMAVNSLCGLNMPTFAGSATATTAGLLLPISGAVYNVCLQQNGTTENDPWASNFGTAYQRILDNVVLLQNSGSYNTANGARSFKGNANFGKVTMPFSGTGDGFGNSLNAYMRHLVVASRSIIPGAFIRVQASGCKIGVLEIQTQSMGFLVGRNNTSGIEGTSDNIDGKAKIGRVIGRRPVTAIASLGSDGYFGFHIDDLYGEGPSILGGFGPPLTRVASSGEATVDIGSGAVNALVYNARSYVAGNQQYWVPFMHRPVMRKLFDVTSGTGIEIRVPIYVDSTAIFSPAGGGLWAELEAAGCNAVVGTGSSVLVGSPTKWAGSLISGGSAYLWSCVFTPRESANNVPFEVFFSWPTQATSGGGITFNAFLGEPYKVP